MLRSGGVNIEWLTVWYSRSYTFRPMRSPDEIDEVMKLGPELKLARVSIIRRLR